MSRYGLKRPGEMEKKKKEKKRKRGIIDTMHNESWRRQNSIIRNSMMMKFAFEGIGRGTGKKEHLSNAPEGTSASDQVRKRVSSRQAAGKMEKKERNGDEKRGKEGMQGMTRVCEVTGKCEEKQLNIPLWKNKCGRPLRIMHCTAIRGHLCSTSAV